VFSYITLTDWKFVANCDVTGLLYFLKKDATQRQGVEDATILEFILKILLLGNFGHVCSYFCFDV
jgi:hypothetical protein